jgi:outer membrane murein-binding lipoprotein Lpp
MKKILGLSLILTGAMLTGGCATKKYVQQTAAPIQTKVDQVADQANKQGSEIDAAKKDIERHETGINAAKEKAMSAENRANEAMTAANKADPR